MEDKIITLAFFDNIHDMKLGLLRSLLDQADIPFMTLNENMRGIEPALSMLAANISIELRIFEKDAQEALELFNSIK